MLNLTSLSVPKQKYAGFPNVCVGCTDFLLLFIFNRHPKVPDRLRCHCRWFSMCSHRCRMEHVSIRVFSQLNAYPWNWTEVRKFVPILAPNRWCSWYPTWIWSGCGFQCNSIKVTKGMSSSRVLNRPAIFRHHVLLRHSKFCRGKIHKLDDGFESLQK